MAVTSSRTITIELTGGVTGTEVIEAADNPSSPGAVDIKTLTSGFNTITLPTGGSAVRAVTIVPPAGNTTSITLKGITGDTGIALHPSDPTSLAFASSVTTFGLTVGADIAGVRFFYS